MATTGFWPVKGSLKDVVKYAENPDKTTNPKYLDDDLAAALKYVANDDKTDKLLFVGAINCPPVRAYEQMMETKRRRAKTDDENESFDNLKYYVDVNRRQRHEVKYPLDELNFTTKIGKTEYEVSTSFDISGKQTLLEQFKKLILS